MKDNTRARIRQTGRTAITSLWLEYMRQLNPVTKTSRDLQLRVIYGVHGKPLTPKKPK